MDITITLKLKDQEICLSYNEAIELMNALNKFFGPKNSDESYPIPYRRQLEDFPDYPGTAPKIFCSTEGGTS